ncbi:DUF4214 domain-containing protein [Ectopseudomonas oleovorans]|uniref:DUF4214 domain-containing protein n=1 Tax=Ectopseudomonas oleovorans TaxID=301 RepID=UPI003F1B3066
MATVQQEVAALYSAIFNRAPDQAGLNNWVNLIQGGASLTQTADGFVQHPVFTELYAGLTNIQFIQQLYINVLGSEGDAKGIQNWANLLASGVSKAQVVADFVKGALDVDLDAMLASGELTQAEYDAAVVRQDTLTNKANVGIYFAETFGAASNLDPATDTSTVAGLQADPAYLASQAAIANVTADAASVAAAKGRIDVAVGTNDPAGSLIGQNSALTAALVDLQEARADQADALEALAIAVNDASANPVTDAAALKAYIAGFNDTAADAAILAAQNGVPNAESAVATAKVALNNARAGESDAALAQKVVTATADVNADTTPVTGAKALFDAVKNANAALASNIAGAGSDKAVLEGLRDALVGFVNAGDPSTTSLGADTVAELLDDVNSVLNPATSYADAAAAAAAYKALVDTFVVGGVDTYSVTAPTTDAQKALQAAIDKVETRDKLYEADSAAETAFSGTPGSLGDKLRDAEDDVKFREKLIDDVTKAEENVVVAQAYLEKMTGLYGTYTAAEDDEAAALAAIEALDVSLNETVTATPENDLFVADLSATPQDYAIAGFGVVGDDQLFIGTGYQFGGATSETVTSLDALLAGGSTSTLEVFFQQSGTDTIVHIETKAFANGAATPADDLVSITLTGVAAADLVFENGFVSFA